MDVVSIITAEHKLVDTLFEAYKTEANPQQKRGIANNIIKLLSTHGLLDTLDQRHTSTARRTARPLTAPSENVLVYL